MTAAPHDIMDRDTFREEVEAALAHVRDVVRLRVMDLAAVLAPEAEPNQRGWALSRYLLQAIQSLRPDGAEADDWPRRRYDLLSLRYVNGLDPETVAQRLSISRRHFYRQLRRALDEFAAYLWTESRVNQAAATSAAPDDPVDRLTLLRQESETVLRSPQHSGLGDILDSIAGLLAPVIRQRGIELQCDVPAVLPPISVGAEIVKQLLLGLVGELLKIQQVTRLRIEAAPERDDLRVVVRAYWEPAGGLAQHTAQALDASLADKSFVELARLQGIQITRACLRESHCAYGVLLPTVGERTVLVVDDNEDVCLLFRRYLVSGGYQPLVARTGAEAIRLAQSRSLYAITLDLMMSHEDGWDVLQSLRHDPQTADLPVIVCSVLDQEQLALMLGATAFIKKPVMADALLQTLARLES